MSSEEKKQEPNPNTDKEQTRGAITTIYQLPKSVGIAKASNDVITTTIDIKELQEALFRINLADQKVIIMIPVDPQNVCSTALYTTQMLVTEGGSNNCDPNCDDANRRANEGYIVDPVNDPEYYCKGTAYDGRPVVYCCKK